MKSTITAILLFSTFLNAFAFEDTERSKNLVISAVSKGFVVMRNSDFKSFRLNNENLNLETLICNQISSHFTECKIEANKNVIEFKSVTFFIEHDAELISEISVTE